MNNFVFSQDPLLFQSQMPRTFNDDINIKQQMDDSYMKYKALQEQYKNLQRPEIETQDRVKELNDILTGLTTEEAQKVVQNEEYGQLHNSFQGLIQEELLNTIKWKINNNPKAEKNIARQIEIIKSIKKESEDESRRNMSELNDYMKNYSSMSFDEYKRIKNREIEENNKDVKKANRK